MKKILLSAVVITAMVACDKKAENVDSKNADSTKVEAATMSEETTSDPSMPKFSSPEVQKMAEEYAAFVKEYMAAYKAGDAAKIQELVTKQQEWATKLSTSTAAMTPEDVKLWTEYVQKLSEELTAAAMPAK